MHRCHTRVQECGESHSFSEKWREKTMKGLTKREIRCSLLRACEGERVGQRMGLGRGEIRTEEWVTASPTPVPSLDPCLRGISLKEDSCYNILLIMALCLYPRESPWPGEVLFLYCQPLRKARMLITSAPAFPSKRPELARSTAEHRLTASPSQVLPLSYFQVETLDFYIFILDSVLCLWLLLTFAGLGVIFSLSFWYN